MGTVLLVDDSPADRALFRTILGRAGLQVVDAASGLDVPDRLDSDRPDIVVLDVNLPDVLGIDLCRTIRADTKHGRIPILMLTARQAETDILAGLDAGADDYVAKDDPHAVIVARVLGLIRYRRMAHASIFNEQLAQIGRLVAGIVHEIRGPLSVIRGHAELLQLEQESGPGESPWLEPILRNVELLQSRLEYLMASVRTGQGRRVACSGEHLIREAVNLYTKGVDPFRESLQIQLDAGGGPTTCLADAGQIVQALLCLLSHAHRATASRGTPAVLTITSGEESGAFLVQILDGGREIPATDLQRIFEPFSPGRDGDDSIGLHLAASIVAEHGGTLHAENRAEGGVAMILRLPVLDQGATTP